MSNIERVTEKYLENLVKRKQKKLIIEWFKKRGVEPELDYDNYPIITNEIINKVLGTENLETHKKRKRGDRGALKEAMGVS